MPQQATPPPLPRPTPQRHWRDNVADWWDERILSRPKWQQLAVAVGVPLLVLTGVALLLLRPTGPAPSLDQLPTIETLPAPSPSTEVVPTPAPAPLIVHVAGAVLVPGVYELDTTARTVDAIEAAGGASTDADLDRVNLAAPAVDGQRIYVPLVGEADPGMVSATVGTGAQERGPVDLNVADADTLDTLPGIGPTTALAIVAHRQEHGPFATVDDLVAVPGIGPAKLAALRDFVLVS